MKIISKFKDYYDFVAGIDKDSLIIYPRQFQKIIDEKDYDLKKSKFPHEITKFFKCEEKIIDKLIFNSYKIGNFNEYDHGYIPEKFGQFIFLSFCGINYNIFRTVKNEYIYTLEEFIEKVDPKKELKFTINYGKNFGWDKYEKFFEPLKTKNNDLINSPIAISYKSITIEGRYLHGEYINQRLMDIQFNKVFTPTQCYQKIYNWISEHKPEALIPNSPDDMARYESKGFDKKTSFRKM